MPLMVAEAITSATAAVAFDVRTTKAQSLSTWIRSTGQTFLSVTLVELVKVPKFETSKVTTTPASSNLFDHYYAYNHICVFDLLSCFLFSSGFLVVTDLAWLFICRNDASLS